MVSKSRMVEWEVTYTYDCGEKWVPSCSQRLNGTDHLGYLDVGYGITLKKHCLVLHPAVNSRGTLQADLLGL
jgi:hypothetical protein